MSVKKYQEFIPHAVLQDSVKRLWILEKEYTAEDDVEEIEDFLIGKRLNTLYEPRQVQAAAKLLYRTKGQFRITELADYCHLSLRQLQRQFDEATSISPKTLARTIRFEAIRNRLMFERA